MPGLIDSFWISLGYKTDTSGLRDMKRHAEEAKVGMMEVGSAIKAIAAGFVVRGIAQIGDQFEQNRIQIAGFLSALGVSSDFNAGLLDADATIRSITTAAAKLPGEAEEYVAVFKAAVPFLAKALPGGSLSAMTDFTNQFTAIGKTLGVDADQIGRDLNLMIGPTGRAGQHVKTFQQMVPFMRQVKGQANLTAQSFNAMTATKRVELLKAAFIPLGPMLEASASSFDAMWGAFRSGLKQLTRLGTAGLFEAMKTGLDRINGLFFDTTGNLTAFGKSIVENAKMVSGWAIELVRDVADVALQLGEMWRSGKLGKLMFIGLAAAVVGFKRVLTGGILGLVALLADDLIKLATGNESLIGMLIDKWPKAITAAVAGLGVLGAAVVAFHVLNATSMTGVALALGGAFLPIFGAILGVLALVAAIGVLVAVITDAGHKWSAFKEDVKIQLARIKDRVPGMDQGIPGYNESVARAAKGALDEKFSSDAAKAAGLRNTSGAMNGPDVGPGGHFGEGPMEAPGDRDTRQWQKWEPSSGSKTVNSTTHVTIHVDGSKDPDATAKAIDKHLERRDRATIRNASTKIGL